MDGYLLAGHLLRSSKVSVTDIAARGAADDESGLGA